MTINAVEAFAVGYPEPNDNGAQRHLVLCRVDDSSGLSGWGEAVTMTLGASHAVVALIASLGPLLEGTSAVANVATWQRIRAAGWWYGHGGGLAAFALSALDLALWDLKGRLLDTSLVDLLGGALRPELRAIATTHAFLPSIEEEAARHGAYVHEDGFAGVKVGLGKAGSTRVGYDHDRDVAFVRALREAMGEDALLVVDRGQSLRWSVAEATARTRAFEDCGLLWIEEPLEPGDIDGFRRLRSLVGCLVGTGEREWTSDGYRRVIDSGIVDVVGFDPGRAEGVTGGLRVIRDVEASFRWFNAHAFSGALVTAASLALTATTDRSLLFEMKPLASPAQDDLVHEPIRAVGGRVQVPTGPGLGVDVDPGAVEHYRVG